MNILSLCLFACLLTAAAKDSVQQTVGQSDLGWNPEVTRAAEGQPVRWINDLGLDEKQKEKIRSLWRQNRGDVKQRREQLNSLREELRAMIAGTGPADKAMELHRKIQSLQTELNTIDMISMLAIRDLLSPQQREKFVKHMALRGRLGANTPPARQPDN